MKWWLSVLLLVLWGFSSVAQAQLTGRQIEPQQVVDDARKTLQEMATHPDYEALLADLQVARGVLIFPRVVRGGFFVGGSGGLGVFLAWDDARGDYSPVAFYSVAAVSVGLQFGAEVAEVVMVAKTQRAVDSLFASAFRLGGDASVAAGPVGAGRRSTITADFVSYARNQGAFLGMSLEGSMLRIRDDFNESYYGEKLRPVQIIESRRGGDPGAVALRQALAEYRQPPRSVSHPAPDPAEASAGPPPAQETESIAPGSGGLIVDPIQVESL